MERKDITKVLFYLGLFLLFIFIRPVFPLKNINRIKTRELNIKYYNIQKLNAQKQYSNVVSECKKLIKDAPYFDKIYSSLAKGARKNGQLKEAISFMEDLMSTAPGNPYFLYGTGLCYQNNKNLPRARTLYKKSIEFNAKFRAVYTNLVNSAKTPDDQTALIKYLENLIKKHPNNNFLYSGLGRLYQYKVKNYKKSLEYYQKALSIAKKSGNHNLIGEELSALGLYYGKRAKFTESISAFENAIKSFKLAGNKNAEAKSNKDAANNCIQQSKFPQAIKYLNEGLKLSKEAFDKILEARILLSKGYINFIRTDLKKALSYLNPAFALAREYGHLGLAGACQRAMGSVNLYRGNYNKAIESYQEVLEIVKITNDKYNEGSALWEIGSVYRKTGKYSKALSYYQKALKVAQDNDIKRIIANSLVCIAIIHAVMGESDKELKLYQQALKMQREMGTKNNLSNTLYNIGSVYSEQKNFSKAIECLSEAISIVREIKNKRSEFFYQDALATVYIRKGDYPTALQKYLDFKDEVDKSGLSDAIMAISYKLGLIYYKLNDYQESIKYYNKSLKLARKLGRPHDIWRTLSGLADVYAARKEYSKALSFYKKSILTIEDVRSKLRLGEHKSAFFKSHIRVYEAIVDLLFRLYKKDPNGNYHQEAFTFIEKAKARAFFDRLQEAKIDLVAGKSPEIREKELMISREISKVQTALLKEGVSDSKRKELLERLAEFDDQYKNMIIQIKRENPEYAKIAFAKPYKLKDIGQKLLDRDSAVIEYFISGENIYLFFITKKEYSVHKLKNSKQILDRVENYIDILSNKSGEYFLANKAGYKLYNELFEPIKEKLKKIKKLILIPDRKLHYLPFETLVVNKVNGDNDVARYLVNNHQITYTPSASSLVNLLSRKRGGGKKKDLLAFADPAYIRKTGSKTQTVTEQTPRELYYKKRFTFTSLKYSKEEVQGIAGLMNNSLSDVYYGAKALEETVKKLPLKDYKVLHFATHGLLDENVAGHSGLVLTLDDDTGEDGFFQVWEIYNIHLNADLVVLSACQTGKGKLEKGEGVTGLASAFLYAGAESVVVSLWNINDKATSVVMKYFYEYLIQGKSKSEALRLAKLKMLDTKYGQPYYWGAFVLIGDHNKIIKFSK